MKSNHVAAARVFICSVVGCISMFFAAPLCAEQIDVIDTPSVGLLDYGTYNINFRFEKGGGVVSRLNFGVFKVVNLGFAWEIDRIIGTDDVAASPPALYLKVRPYNGGMHLPAIAFGYDGQGYGFNRDSDTYTTREKGIFLVLGREYFLPGLQLDLGASMPDFKTNRVYAFTGARYDIEDALSFLFEYDNINSDSDNRLNIGCRLAINSNLHLDLAGRDLVGVDRHIERVVRIDYQGRF